LASGAHCVLCSRGTTRGAGYIVLLEMKVDDAYSFLPLIAL
jgi:hypothetical protein